MKTYLEISSAGKNDWWRYILSVFFILFMWFFVGSIPLLILITILTLNGTPPELISANGISSAAPLWNFIATVASFLPLFISIPLAIRFIHKRPMQTIITPAKSIHWRRIFNSFAVWFFLSGIITFIEALLYPGRYIFSMDLPKLLPFLIATLLLIPFQSSAEEFFFRGFLLQWVGLKLKNRLALSLISGLLFALPHILNPEVSVDFWLTMSFYFIFGVFAAWVTLKDNGLELALGMHAANNIYACIFANYSKGVLQTPAFFTTNQLDASYNLAATAVSILIFYFVFFQPWKAAKKELELI